MLYKNTCQYVLYLYIYIYIYIYIYTYIHTQIFRLFRRLNVKELLSRTRDDIRRLSDPKIILSVHKHYTN